MSPWESRRSRHNALDRRRPAFAVEVQALETRQLLASSPLGSSLPDLQVSGFGPTVASWGRPMAVTINLRNIASSTLIEPLALAPGSTSTADAPASVVGVYATRSPRSLAGAVLLGSVQVPAVTQNNAVQVTSSIVLPNQPRGFPGDGGRIYVVLKANATGNVFDSDSSNNVSTPFAVQIQAPLPELAAVGLDVPPVMQPGDTIQPNIRIANFGPVDTSAQGPVQVALVASTTPTFTAGSSIVALYSVQNVPAQSLAPSLRPVFGDANLTPALNVVTIAGDPVTLPAFPTKFYLGVVVDPNNQIKQLQRVPQFTKPKNPFSLSHVVQTVEGLPPAGVLVAGGITNVPQFPVPFGKLPVGGSADGTIFPAPFPGVSLASIGTGSTTDLPVQVRSTGPTVSTANINQTAAGSFKAFGSRRAMLQNFGVGKQAAPAVGTGIAGVGRVSSRVANNGPVS